MSDAVGQLHPRRPISIDARRPVAEALAVTGLDPARLVLEITESTAMAPNSQEQLLALRATGIRLAIDDFGTGHSSLSRLAVLPVNALKVDRSFVRDIPVVGDAPLVRAMIAMAHSLGLTVVAEGIETREELDACIEMGIHCGQGFYLGRPLPAWKLFDADPTGLPPHCPFVRYDLLPKLPAPELPRPALRR